MSAIFISHSSRDNEVAAEVRERLQAVGHRSIFLDFDPADGIPPGRNWEQELYARLRACQAIVVLCSESSMASDWVFAEITHAKSLGKYVFPIKVAPCEIRSLLNEFQVLDLTADREDAYARLLRGLEVAGLDPKNMFDWDGSRPPYPGLLAFQAADAAIFFGRDTEIREGLAQLRRLERFGGARWTLVLGASGSGKSSLVRAGLLPRLGRDRDAWLITRPFRPLDKPFDQLSQVLAEAFEQHGEPRPSSEILRRLYPSTGVANAVALVELVRELQQLARSASKAPVAGREATVLLAVDQLEELLGHGTGEQASRFLAFLRAASEQKGSPIRLLGTLRSDFLGAFQGHSALRELAFENLGVGPMSVDGFAQVIEGPAELAGIELGPGLVQAMVGDTETDDALPLLAFTLRELWEGYGEDSRLHVEEYRDKLGGLSGAVALAAEAVLSARGALSDREQADLRTAFLAMVRINEDGQYTRSPALWSELPLDAHDLLERFVQARLLVSHGDGLEVAHEALLRSWDRLVGWLDEDRAFLVWRKRLEEARREWQRTERDAGALLRGTALGEAEGWSPKRHDLLSRDQLTFISASSRAARRRRRQKVGMVAVAIILLAVFAGWSHMQRLLTKKVVLMAEDSRALAHSREVRAKDPRRAGETLLTLHNPDVFLKSMNLEALHLSGAVLGKSKDGMLVAEAAGDDVVVRLTFDDQWSVRLAHDAPVYKVAIESPDAPGLFGEAGSVLDRSSRGRRLMTAAGGDDKVISLWELPEIETILIDLLDGKLPPLMRRDRPRDGRLLATFDGHDARVSVMSVSPDGRYAVTAGDDQVALWRTDTGAEPVILGGQEGGVTSACVNGDSRWLLTTSDDGAARLWSLADVFEAPRVLRGHRAGLLSGAFSRDSARILTLSENGEIWQWTTTTGKGSRIATADCDGLEIGFADIANVAILACADGTARVFTPGGGDGMKVLR